MPSIADACSDASENALIGRHLKRGRRHEEVVVTASESARQAQRVKVDLGIDEAPGWFNEPVVPNVKPVTCRCRDRAAEAIESLVAQGSSRRGGQTHLVKIGPANNVREESSIGVGRIESRPRNACFGKSRTAISVIRGQGFQ